MNPVERSQAPPNCTFVMGDVEKPWTLGRKFDYIHDRFLGLGIKDWNSVIQHCFDHLHAGGLCELQEFVLQLRYEGEPQGNRAMERLASSMKPLHADPSSLFRGQLEDIHVAGRKIGVNTLAALDFQPILEKAGFVNIQKIMKTWPIGDWRPGPKDQEIALW